MNLLPILLPEMGPLAILFRCMKDKDTKKQSEPTRQSTENTVKSLDEVLNPRPKEIGGPSGPEPTRYGDWERKGRCIDF